MSDELLTQRLRRTLLGEWQGVGVGTYPTIEGFEYLESLRFWDGFKPWLGVQQRTVGRLDGEPLHSESAYLRFIGPTNLEMVVAHPFGSTEIYIGTVSEENDHLAVLLECDGAVSSPTAKPIGATQRRIRVFLERIEYEFSMQAGDQPFQAHLRAQLERVGG